VGAVAAMAFEHASVIEQLQAHNSRLEKALDLQHDLIGESAAMAELQKLIAKAAPSDSTVLIQGESGTGKELVARALHRNSTRSHAPFVAVNCAALTESLSRKRVVRTRTRRVHRRHRAKEGAVRTRGRRDLFLDEVGELAPAIQAKLLRALQEKEIKRVGGEREIKVDVRLVAATNRNLDQAVEANQFRRICCTASK
jgi:transcriptional regulator with GAF, ATPase, and Fis domain